jgi:pimeloyl-ACP methyl ester carboxylesterase
VSLGKYSVYVRTVPERTVPERTVPESAVRERAVRERAVPESTLPETRGEPALFVHGLAGSSRNWTDLMDLLSPQLAGMALDLPGSGDSPPRPDGRYSISAMAQTVATLIERQGRGPVHLLGNSMGGAISLRVAAKRPHLVKSLTLISPALPEVWPPRLDLVRFPLLSVPRLGNWLLGKYQVLPAERRVAATFATCYFDPAQVPAARLATEVAELTRRDSLPYAQAAMIGYVRALTTESLRAGGMTSWREAAQVTVPTLVIYGSDDRLVSSRMAGRAARAFRHGRIVVLPRTGHVAQMERPAEVAAEVGVLTRGTPLIGAGLIGAGEFPLTPAG